MTSTHGTTRRRPNGFSLLEMVLSLTVLAVAFSAVGSVFLMASRVMPRPGSAEAASVRQSAALTRLVEDLEQARFITAGSANSVTFVVDDRTGDGLPERITYDWSGVAGDPLTFSINGSDPADVAVDVRAFLLSGQAEARTDRVPMVNDAGAEQALFSYTSPALSAAASITSSSQLGQLIQPDLPQSAAGYTVTRVRARARRNGVAFGGVNVQVRGYDSDTLTLLPVDEQVNARESDFGTGYAWHDFVFASPPRYPAGSPAAVTIDHDGGSVSADFEYDDVGGSGVLWSTDGGSNYTLYNGKSMVAEVFGSVITEMPGVEVTRTVITRADITLQLGEAATQTATARLYREPSGHRNVWAADMDAAPTGVDLNGNGADWAAQSGGASSSFVDGRWVVDGTLYSQPTQLFDTPLVVNLKMGATAPSRSGATFRINADQAGGMAVPLAVKVGRDAAGDHCVRVYDDEAQATPRMEVAGLGENLPEVRLLIVPADNAVGLLVNGEPAGSFLYTPVSAAGLPGVAVLTEGSDGVIDGVTIRFGTSAVVTLPGGDTNTSDDGGGGVLGWLLG